MNMNRQILGMALVICSFNSLAGGCEQREYAEYKDLAKTESGRRKMAFEYCIFGNRRDAAMKLYILAGQYGVERDMNEAKKAIDSCDAGQSKITTVLTTAKATKTMEFMLGGCGIDEKTASEK